MNYIEEIKKIFHVSEMNFNERVKKVEIQFTIDSNNLPSFEQIENFMNSIPKRDSIKITYTDESDYVLTVTLEPSFIVENYDDYCRSAKESNDSIDISLSIDKEVMDSCFSIYSYNMFTEDIVKRSIKDVLSAFSLLYQGNEKIFFEVMDADCFFKTKTMIFSSPNKRIVQEEFDRNKRLEECKTTSYFYNIMEYTLIPDDFKIEMDFEGNPLSDLFNKITTILSLVYISSTATFEDGKIKYRIQGQRSIDFVYEISQIKNNFELFKIYNWIYTDGNPTDKAIIARNILCLHCRFSEVLGIDGKTFASIQSNFNLYIKDNVTKYIELKNELAGFISEFVSKTGEYAIRILDKFKSNIIAICAFIFTVVLANIVSDKPLNSIFTKDIIVILNVVLFISALYLIIGIWEVKFEKKKVEDSYQKLKKNYESILTKEDLLETFNDDKLINDMMKFVNDWTWIFSITWAIILIIAFVYLNCFACK